MSDVPPDGQRGSAPGDAEYPPPPSAAPQSSFDDDALAAALEADMRPYTQPISVVPPAAPAPPASQAPSSSAPAPAPPAPPASAPWPPVTGPGDRITQTGPVPPAAPVPPSPAPPAPSPFPPASPPVPPAAVPTPPAPGSATSRFPVPEESGTGAPGPSTLDAIERLEEELRRRGMDPGVAPIVPPPAAPAPPSAGTGAPPPAPTTPVAPAAEEWLNAPPPAAPPAPPRLVEPAPPPTREVRLEDVQGLPPPIGQTAAPIPPYQPAVPPPPPMAEAPSSATGFTGFAGPGIPAPAQLDRIDEGGSDDAVDDVDRVFGIPQGGAVAPDGPVAWEPAPDPATGAEPAPSGPLPTSRVTASQPALLDGKPQQHPVFVVEHAGAEPTALDLRAGRAARLFWLWFATNSSVVSVGLGAVLFSAGVSLRQAIVATLTGVALSFLPLGLGTLAGKWSGQPTMVVSRATFGHAGNIVPTVVAVLTRAFWGAVLLWLFAYSAGELLEFGGIDVDMGAAVWTYVVLGVTAVLCLLIAIFGYGFVALVQLISCIVGGVLVVGLVVITWPRLDLDAALATGDGAWTAALGGAVLVFSFVGLAWVQSSSDVARYQRPGSSGAQSMLWGAVGATLPPFVLISWGAMLAASDPAVARGLAESPLTTIARMLPLWYPAPLLAAAGLGLISGIVLSMYSGGFALQSLGVRARRSMTTAIAGGLVILLAVGFVLLDADAFTIARDVATTLAVPVAAWAGIFAAEMMIRTRRFDSPSLLMPGGVYPQVRVVNLVGYLLITAVSFGFTTATLPGLTWQGFLFAPLGIDPEDPFARSDVGVFIALLLGLILALASAIPAIRRQERESLRLEHTGPVRVSGSVPRVTGSVAQPTGSVPQPTGSVPLPDGQRAQPPLPPQPNGPTTGPGGPAPRLDA